MGFRTGDYFNIGMSLEAMSGHWTVMRMAISGHWRVMRKAMSGH